LFVGALYRRKHVLRGAAGELRIRQTPDAPLRIVGSLGQFQKSAGELELDQDEIKAVSVHDRKGQCEY